MSCVVRSNLSEFRLSKTLLNSLVMIRISFTAPCLTKSGLMPPHGADLFFGDLIVLYISG